MAALLIISAILLLLFLILIWDCHIRILYLDGELTARVTFLGIVLEQYPEKEEKVKVSDYTPRKIKQRQKRLKRKRALLKGAPPPPKKTAKQKREEQLLEDIGFIRHLLLPFLYHGLKRVRLYAKRIRIVVSSDEAAKTAILYGAVTPAVATLLEVVEGFKQIRRPKDSEISVIADFTAGECSADIDILLKLHLYQVISILFKSFYNYAKSQMEEDTDSQNKDANHTKSNPKSE